jgi:hypothetical protein
MGLTIRYFSGQFLYQKKLFAEIVEPYEGFFCVSYWSNHSSGQLLLYQKKPFADTVAPNEKKSFQVLFLTATTFNLNIIII